MTISQVKKAVKDLPEEQMLSAFGTSSKAIALEGEQATELVKDLISSASHATKAVLIGTAIISEENGSEILVYLKDVRRN